MRALIEIDVTGDFEDLLSEREIKELLNAVICDGAESVCMTANYKILEILDN